MKTAADKARKRPWLVSLAAHTYGRFLKRKYKLEFKNKELLDQVSGSCIVMSNHCHILDPCFISTIFPFHIRWVTGSYLFKIKVFGTILDKQVTCISKKQGRSDFSTILTIKNALKAGNCVGLFPEGTRTWDGDFSPLKKNTTAKMLRFFKVPVVFINLEGAYVKKPRWADKSRKGDISVKIVSILKPETLKDMKIEELNALINKNLGFSNDKWQMENKLPYPSKHIAEGFQRVAYICPKCGAFDSLVTKGNKIVCSNCGSTTEMDEYSRLKSVDHNFTKLSDWRKWETDKIKKTTTLPIEKGIIFETAKDNKLFNLSKDFKVNIQNACINVYTANKNYTFEINKITSLILNAKQTIEFYYDSIQYRIRLLPNSCSLKYLDYFTVSNDKKEN